jgi:hypothetical protein
MACLQESYHFSLDGVALLYRHFARINAKANVVCILNRRCVHTY